MFTKETLIATKGNMVHEMSGSMFAMLAASAAFHLTLLVLAVFGIAWLGRELFTHNGKQSR